MNDKFVNNVVSMLGDEGRKWLDEIPSIIAQYEEQWELKVLPPYKLTYNYVAPAERADGSNAVLKIGIPGDEGVLTEMRALRFFNGDGAVKLYETDETHNTMLLEKIVPGDMLVSLDDDTERVAILAEVIKKIDRQVPHHGEFPTIADWAKGFDRLRERNNGATGPFDKTLFEKAEAIYKSYVPNPLNDFLLHGDLHEENVLLSDRGWLAIDPKGIIGVPEFETAMFLNDPFSDMPNHPDLKALVTRRIEQLADALQYDKKIIRDWAFAQSMLSTLWVLEDHKQVSEVGMQNVRLLDEIRF
jgi:streptomycin 6-kinase